MNIRVTRRLPQRGHFMRSERSVIGMFPRVQTSVSRSSSRVLTHFAVDFPLSTLLPRHLAWTRHPALSASLRVSTGIRSILI